MNPFDAMNSDTSKNSDGIIRNHQKATESKKTSRQAKNKVNNKRNKIHKSNRQSTKSKQKSLSLSNSKLIKELSSQYSTDRLNMYDIIRLKLLQKVNNMKSRSQLINDMIKLVKPVYLNSPAKRKQYQSLFKYALTGFKINKKFK